MKKEEPLLSGTNIMERTKSGMLSILTSQLKTKLKDSTRNMVCIATDHST
jgi:hypothetical protein